MIRWSNKGNDDSLKKLLERHDPIKPLAMGELRKLEAQIWAKIDALPEPAFQADAMALPWVAKETWVRRCATVLTLAFAVLGFIAGQQYSDSANSLSEDSSALYITAANDLTPWQMFLTSPTSLGERDDNAE